MFVLRSSLALILVTLLLPWGAFSKTFPSGDVAGVSVDRAGDPVEIVMSAARKCRPAALLGSSCGPDLINGQSGVIFFGPACAALSFREENWRLAGFSQSPATGPPRLS